MLLPQTCKVCLRPDGFDFHVPNKVWRRVVPKRYVNNVVCLRCFDLFAFAKDVPYAKYIKRLYFAGEQECLKLEAQNGHPR